METAKITKDFKQPKIQSPWPFIFKVCRPYRWCIAGLVFVGVLWAIDISIRPYILKTIIDRMSKTYEDSLWIYLQGPIVLYLGFSLFNVLNLRYYDYLGLKFVPEFKNRIIRDLTTHILGHSHSYFQSNFAGSLANKVNDVATGSKEVIYIIIDRFLSNGIAIIVAAITFATVSPILALILLGWAVVFVSFTYAMSERIHGMAFDMSNAKSLFTGQIVDLISNHLTVRLFARERYERENLLLQGQDSIIKEKKLRWLLLFINLFQGVSFVLMVGGSFSYLVWAKENNLVTIGDFALILSVTIAIVDQLWGLSKDFSEFIEELGRVAQGLTVTSLPHEIQNHPYAVPLRIKKGEIQFEDVQFWYKSSKPLFDQLNLTIRGGEKVGLVGFSGSGKTTIVNLILRLYDIHKGSIHIDHQDISMVTLESLHQQIAMIPQEPSLLNRSIYDNIRYGKLDATEGEVFEAARQAHAHEFILRMPDKYDTFVGERGSRLSGGQRQRIAIARAILKDAPILLLDEATSALDTLTEGIIQQSLNQLMQNRTTLIIAHRLSTLMNMDRILVFDSGCIIEDGAHEELIGHNNLYAKLWKSQVNGFILDKPAHRK